MQDPSDVSRASTKSLRDQTVYTADDNGIVASFSAVREIGAPTSLTFDLKKNGVSIVAESIELTPSDGPCEIKTAKVVIPQFQAGRRAVRLNDRKKNRRQCAPCLRLGRSTRAGPRVDD